MVANDTVPNNMTWSRILAPFIWESSTERGRSVLREVFGAAEIPPHTIEHAAGRWRALGIVSFQGARAHLARGAQTVALRTEREVEAPLPGGYIQPELQEG
eukprot:8082437-Pyramimonas_sp.AAC.1